MNPARRRAYLNAMGIESWTPRLSPVAVAEKFVIGPGEGNTLFVCGRPEEAATALAADIARSLDGEPVWSWPEGDESMPGMSLSQAIEERLFTRILVFGSGLLTLDADSGAQVLGSARLMQSDSIPDLMDSGAARRRLWLALSASLWSAR